MISKILNRNLFSHSSKQLIDLEHQFGCHNYGPLPIVAARGQGALIWDVEGTFDVTQENSTLI